MAFKDPEAYRAYMRRYMQERRARGNEAGVKPEGIKPETKIEELMRLRSENAGLRYGLDREEAMLRQFLRENDALKAEVERLRAGVKPTVNEELVRLLAENAELKKRLAAERLVGKPFSNEEFRSVLRSLHSDSTTEENRKWAFLLMKDRQQHLRPEEDEVCHFRVSNKGERLPETLPERTARRPRKSKAEATAPS